MWFDVQMLFWALFLNDILWLGKTKTQYLFSSSENVMKHTDILSRGSDFIEEAHFRVAYCQDSWYRGFVYRLHSAKVIIEKYWHSHLTHMSWIHNTDTTHMDPIMLAYTHPYIPVRRCIASSVMPNERSRLDLQPNGTNSLCVVLWEYELAVWMGHLPHSH